MKYYSGEEFLNKLYTKMHMEDVVMHTAEKGDSPEQKIEKYLGRLDKVHDQAKTSKHKMKLLKQFYYDKYIIKEVPESYITLQQRIAEEEGQGNITITEALKQQMLTTIQNDQKASLDVWIDYLSSDDAMYPTWFKNYAFQGMLQLSSFDKKRQEFGKRTKSTSASFIELNREVLAQVYNTLSKQLKDFELSETEEEALLQGESFKKLYSYYFKKTGILEENKETDGIWIKYDQGNNYKPLWESLQGKNTGWCTAGEETAKLQLGSGDFYVYYTKDEDGEYTNPRIAIRMNGQNEIGEVRGVGASQNLELNMMGIAEKKLAEFPDSKHYKKKVSDMKLITKIDEKVKSNQNLTKGELRFLYEIDASIEGFGYETDPRIEKIISERDIIKDLTIIFDCEENQVATSLDDFNNNDIVCYLGDLTFDGKSIPNNFSNLKAIIGSGNFNLLKDSKGLDNLQIIKGEANFKSLINARGLNNLKNIGEEANFNSLKDSTGLNNLQFIKGSVNFSLLETATGLNSLHSIGEEANFKSLTDARGLDSLEFIGEEAKFDLLTDARGLSNLKSTGDANFSSLINATGLDSLHSIKGGAHFNSLMDSIGLDNLQCIEGNANFNSLRDATNLSNLQSIGLNANFSSLRDATGLNKLKSINGYAKFDSLINAEALEALQSIEGSAHFNSLKDATGLSNLKYTGDAYFSLLINATGLDSLHSIKGGAHFDSLKNSIGLNNLQFIEGSANFNSLTDATGLNKLQSIGLDANFNSLTDAAGLNNLQSIGMDAHFNLLTAATGLNNLQSIGMDAHFNSLMAATGLNNLRSIGMDANFNSLTDATDLNSLKFIGSEAHFDSLIDASPLINCNKYENIKSQSDMNIMFYDDIEISSDYFL